MKSVAILSAIATVVAAASSSSSAATPAATGSPYIPTGISQGCSTFLTDLNDNTTLTSCVKPIVSATSQFGPSGSSGTPSAADVTTALGQLCSATACSDTSIRAQLAGLWTSCSAELNGASANNDVKRIYDVLYAIGPLRTAVCTKDDAGKYCVTQINGGSASSSSSATSTSSSSSSASTVTPARRATETKTVVKSDTVTKTETKTITVTKNVTAALVPNTQGFGQSGLAFLLLTTNTPSSVLCTACTRSILQAYMSWESSIPYGSGLDSSDILGGQTPLYNQVTSVCGSSFMSGAVQAAGGLGQGLGGGAISGAAHLSAEHIASIGSVFAAAAAGLVAFL